MPIITKQFNYLSQQLNGNDDVVTVEFQFHGCHCRWHFWKMNQRYYLDLICTHNNHVIHQPFVLFYRDNNWSFNGYLDNFDDMTILLTDGKLTEFYNISLLKMLGAKDGHDTIQNLKNTIYHIANDRNPRENVYFLSHRSVPMSEKTRDKACRLLPEHRTYIWKLFYQRRYTLCFTSNPFRENILIEEH